MQLSGIGPFDYLGLIAMQHNLLFCLFISRRAGPGGQAPQAAPGRAAGARQRGHAGVSRPQLRSPGGGRHRGPRLGAGRLLSSLLPVLAFEWRQPVLSFSLLNSTPLYNSRMRVGTLYIST